MLGSQEVPNEGDPVHWDEEHQLWVVTRYADVAAALANPRLVRGYRKKSAVKRGRKARWATGGSMPGS